MQKNNKKHIRNSNKFINSFLFLCIISISLLTISIYYWQSQKNNYLNQIKENLKINSILYAAKIQDEFKTINKSLELLSSSAELNTEIQLNLWLDDAQFYCNSFPGLKNIVLVDQIFLIKEIIPLDSNENYINKSANTLLQNDYQIFQMVPIYFQSSFRGYIIGIISIEELIQPIIDQIENDYMLQISKDDEIIYSSNNWSIKNNYFTFNKTIIVENSSLINIRVSITEGLYNTAKIAANKSLLNNILFSIIVILFIFNTMKNQAKKEIIKEKKFIETLRDIDQVIIKNYYLDDTLPKILEKIKNQLNIDAIAILKYDDEKKLLNFQKSIGFTTNALFYSSLKIGESLAGKAAKERDLVYISNLNEINTQLTKSPKFKDENFISYFSVPLIFNDNLIGVLELFHRSFFKNNREFAKGLKIIAGQCAIAINNATMFTNLELTNFKLISAYEDTIEALAHTLELHDMETEGHCRRVTSITIQLANKLDIDDDQQIFGIKYGALLHDIGKIGVPINIINKEGKLSEEEWNIMKQHPIYAYKLLSSIEYLSKAIDIPYCHHEKWDGTGYPRGLKEEQIPLAARIFSIVDVWDALLSDRPYRKAWTKKETINYIKSESGKHFDPKIVKCFLENFEDL